MGKINMGRVLLGGLLAGLVINVGEFALNSYLLGKQWEDALKELNRPATGNNEGMLFYVLLGFALGTFAVWIYAAIRPRFGARPVTAICAGLIVWFLASLYVSAVMLPMHLFPRRLLLYSVIWEFVQMPIAAVAGAWLYREETY
jgi:hypothetical protein